MVSSEQPAAWSTSWLRVVFLKLSASFSFISIYFFGIPEGCPGFGPAGVEPQLGNGLGHFLPGYSVLFSGGHVVLEGTVCQSLGNERRHCHQAPVVEAQLVVGALHLSKKDVIVVPGKIRGKIPQLIPSCGLHDFDRFFVSFSMAAASPKCMPTQVVMTRDSASPANCFMRSSIMIPPSGYLLDVS